MDTIIVLLHYVIALFHQSIFQQPEPAAWRWEVKQPSCTVDSLSFKCMGSGVRFSHNVHSIGSWFNVHVSLQQCGSFLLKRVSCPLVVLCAAHMEQQPWTSEESYTAAEGQLQETSCFWRGSVVVCNYNISILIIISILIFQNLCLYTMYSMQMWENTHVNFLEAHAVIKWRFLYSTWCHFTNPRQL